MNFQEVTVKGKTTRVSIPPDQYSELWVNRTVEPAKVALTVGNSTAYGEQKVSATVSLACDQNESSINKAGELAFYKALELAKDAWDVINHGLPTEV